MTDPDGQEDRMTTTEKPSETQVLHLRIPAELHAAITTYATRTERSLNKAGIHALRTFLREHGDD